MECPYCAESVKDEAIICKHCNSNLAPARPVIFAVQALIVELDALQRELDGARKDIDFIQRPLRFMSVRAAWYVLLPAAVLIAVHFLVTVVVNAHLIYLQLASILIPLLFGMTAYVLHKIGFRSAIVLGAACAVLSVTGMLAAIAWVDGGAILPDNARDWWETAEYMLSIALAFITGNILANFLLRVLPSTIAAGDRPNVLAYRVALVLGRHVADETLRRRARRIQDLARKAGAIASLVVTGSASVYTGLKGIIGP
jgi:hypothetical protein